MCRISLPFLAGLFLLLSMADLSLTLWLLDSKGGAVYEANPLARWILQKHSWPGMVAFKASCALVLIVAVSALAQLRPATAKRLMLAGCLALAITVMWSGVLATTLSSSPHSLLAERQRERRLDLALQEVRERLKPILEKAAAQELRNAGRDSEPEPGDRFHRQVQPEIGEATDERSVWVRRSIPPGKKSFFSSGDWLLQHYFAPWIAAGKQKVTAHLFLSGLSAYCAGGIEAQ